MPPLVHDETLHQQDGINPHTDRGGKAEHVPRVLRRQREKRVVHGNKSQVSFTVPNRVTAKGVRGDVRHMVGLSQDVQSGEG